MTVLQHVILPDPKICGDYRLYADRPVLSEFPFSLDEGKFIVFRGFFNLFSLDKWKKYTSVSDVFLDIAADGKYRVTLMCDAVSVSETEADGNISIRIPSDMKDGQLTFRLDALSDICLYGAEYSVPYEPVRDVRIGFNMCTYRREEYVLSKICSFEKALEFGGKFADSAELFIIDNGKTLGNDICTGSAVHLFPNSNTGGSGGFRRGIEEISSAGSFSNIVFMDDDTVTEPETLYRTWTFLSFCKDTNIILGGTMMLADDMNVVYESGALYALDEDSIHMCMPRKKMLDVSSDEGCAIFDSEEECNYSGWWYCGYPSSFCNPDNLPLALFMKFDDVEYGIRSGMNVVLLNGISVWHERFSSKTSELTEYYAVRNHLYLIGKMGGNLRKYRKKKLKDALSAAKSGNLLKANAVIDAVRDSRRMNTDFSGDFERHTVKLRSRIFVDVSALWLMLKNPF